MDVLYIFLSILNLVILIAMFIFISTKMGKSDNSNIIEKFDKQSEQDRKENREMQSEMRNEISKSISSGSDAVIKSINDLGDRQMSAQSLATDNQIKHIDTLFSSQKEQIDIMRTSQNEKLTSMQNDMTVSLSETKADLLASLKQFELRFSTLETNMDQRLQNIRDTVDSNLKSLRDDNNTQLDKIRGTVDEKLQTTLENKMNESFKLVSERLEQVYRGLGEMQTVAQGVGDLKKVLTNVKTRGILGEIQLGAILKEILTPEQYDENVITVPKSTNRVEFAVKLPGPDDGKTVYLPIDSKFNGDRFAHLQDAYDSGDINGINVAKKELYAAVKKCASDISEKYIYPPYTTQFAIMFLPFEGLYAEVVNAPGLVEELQRVYKINVAGPSTMAAMLNSLRMGFQTLAIQRRSGEVWEILGAVKTEFEMFEKALTDTQDRLRKTEDSLEKLVGVRTRQMTRKLSKIDRLDIQKSSDILSLDE